MPPTSAPEVNVNARYARSQRVSGERMETLRQVDGSGEAEYHWSDDNNHSRTVYQAKTETSEASSPNRTSQRPSDCSSKDTRSTRENPQDDDDAPIFRLGSVVEVRDASAAFPATVTGFRSDAVGVSYNVTSDLPGRSLRDVAAERVHPYRAYADGTTAWCGVHAGGHAGDDAPLLPCTVLSHKEDRGQVFYRVMVQYYAPKRGAVHERTTFLPRTRVMRLFKVTPSGGTTHD